MSEIDGAIFTYTFADAAFLLFEINAAFIDIRDKRNCLSEVNMNGFVLRYLLIESIRILDRAVLYTGSTTGAYALVNVSGLLDQRYIEASCFPCYTVNVGVGQDLDVGVPVDLDQFGRKYSHGAVIGGKGLVKLGHMTANGR